MALEKMVVVMLLGCSCPAYILFPVHSWNGGLKKSTVDLCGPSTFWAFPIYKVFCVGYTLHLELSFETLNRRKQNTQST